MKDEGVLVLWRLAALISGGEANIKNPRAFGTSVLTFIGFGELVRRAFES
jgi:hypothetical protein